MTVNHGVLSSSLRGGAESTDSNVGAFFVEKKPIIEKVLCCPKFTPKAFGVEGEQKAPAVMLVLFCCEKERIISRDVSIMDEYWVYILFSDFLDRFYIGSTGLNPAQRLERHLEGVYGNRKFTAKAADWIVFHTIRCETRGQAKGVESHIKSMKSKKYIRNLKVYSEITTGLLEKYK